jgi:hypothetical protein
LALSTASRLNVDYHGSNQPDVNQTSFGLFAARVDRTYWSIFIALTNWHDSLA